LAKPFLKWAGGKSQLLKQFEKFYPPELKHGKIRTYIEPFLGGGAVFLDVCQKYSIQQAFLSDINQELILVYRVIQSAPEKLISCLDKIASEYKGMEPPSRQQFYYQTRDDYNATQKKINFDSFTDEWIARAAQIIFLNKTCFNGLFRENKKGQFNVPAGQYKNPTILDAPNLREVSRLLQIATITHASFENAEKYIDSNTFIYFDPPYRPISQTANFTTYFRDKFGDADQIRLSQYFTRLDEKYPVKLMLSNSDPQNINPADDFFEQLYAPFPINRISASRMINRDASKRGQVNELVVTNYAV
jgi:DNA adenine methylase